jgi:hypothetical protein
VQQIFEPKQTSCTPFLNERLGKHFVNVKWNANIPRNRIQRCPSMAHSAKATSQTSLTYWIRSEIFRRIFNTGALRFDLMRLAACLAFQTITRHTKSHFFASKNRNRVVTPVKRICRHSLSPPPRTWSHINSWVIQQGRWHPQNSSRDPIFYFCVI